MKKIVPIFLFLIICINHLNIINVIAHYCTKYSDESTAISKNIADEEEPGSENETKEKEKTNEQEKYFAENNYLQTSDYHFSNGDNFICFSTPLNMHPFQDDDIQPPKAA